MCKGRRTVVPPGIIAVRLLDLNPTEVAISIWFQPPWSAALTACGGDTYRIGPRTPATLANFAGFDCRLSNRSLPGTMNRAKYRRFSGAQPAFIECGAIDDSPVALGLSRRIVYSLPRNSARRMVHGLC
jgi:hypothetical protein